MPVPPPRSPGPSSTSFGARHGGPPRRQPAPDPPRARVAAVELVSADASAAAEISGAFVNIFRRPPRDGCLRTLEEGRFRDVHIWVTPNERGGMALISDFGV